MANMRNAALGLSIAGGFIAVLYVFYYMQALSYSIGFDSAAIGLIGGYNLSVNSSLITTISSASVIKFALYITYIMLPFAIIMFAVGILWLFSKAFSRMMSISLAFASLIFILLTALLEANVHFNGALSIITLSYIGGIMSFVAGISGFYEAKSISSKKRLQIEMDPNTPYSNMVLLTDKLVGSLNGRIKILDMHFDTKALDNLSVMFKGHNRNFSEVDLLTKRDRLGKDFEKIYYDFKKELYNEGIVFDLRILDEKDALEQHERLLLDSSSAYKIPPLNIINKKSEHIVGINFRHANHRFDELWARAKKFENS